MSAVEQRYLPTTKCVMSVCISQVYTKAKQATNSADDISILKVCTKMKLNMCKVAKMLIMIQKQFCKASTNW